MIRRQDSKPGFATGVGGCYKRDCRFAPFVAMSSPYFKQPQYSPPPQPMASTSRTSGLAITAMIVGIVSLVTFGCLFGIVGVVAIILSAIALGQISKSSGTITGRGFAITGLICGLITTAFGIAMFVYIARNIDRTESPFMAAKSAIASDSSGRIGHGNSPEAARIAEQIAQEMKSIRDVAIEGEESEFSLSGGKFLTFVQLNEDSVAVMIHVPDLRHYEKDAKELIADAAWATSQVRLDDSLLPDGAEMMVGNQGLCTFRQDLLRKPYQELR